MFSLKSREWVITEAEVWVVSGSDNEFLRMWVYWSVNTSATLSAAPGEAVAQLSEHVGIARGVMDAWAIPDRNQSSYFRSAKLVRWWWSRAVLTRLIVSAITRKLSVAFSWGWSSVGT